MKYFILLQAMSLFCPDVVQDGKLISMLTGLAKLRRPSARADLGVKLGCQ